MHIDVEIRIERQPRSRHSEDAVQRPHSQRGNEVRQTLEPSPQPLPIRRSFQHGQCENRAAQPRITGRSPKGGRVPTT